MERTRIHTTHRKVFVVERPTKINVLINTREITDKGVVKSKEQFKVVVK